MSITFKKVKCWHVELSIGHVSLALENKVGGTWEQDVHIHHVDMYDYVVVIIVIIPK